MQAQARAIGDPFIFRWIITVVRFRAGYSGNASTGQGLWSFPRVVETPKSLFALADTNGKEQGDDDEHEKGARHQPF